MKITYDKTADAVYIKLREGVEFDKVITIVEDQFMLNMGKDGKVNGIEIVDYNYFYNDVLKDSVPVEHHGAPINLEIYTLEETADKLKVNPETVRRYIRAGKLKASKLGNTYRITAEQIKNFLNETVGV